MDSSPAQMFVVDKENDPPAHQPVDDVAVTGKRAESRYGSLPSSPTKDRETKKPKNASTSSPNQFEGPGFGTQGEEPAGALVLGGEKSSDKVMGKIEFKEPGFGTQGEGPVGALVLGGDALTDQIEDDQEGNAITAQASSLGLSVETVTSTAPRSPQRKKVGTPSPVLGASPTSGAAAGGVATPPFLAKTNADESGLVLHLNKNIDELEKVIAELETAIAELTADNKKQKRAFGNLQVTMDDLKKSAQAKYVQLEKETDEAKATAAKAEAAIAVAEIKAEAAVAVAKAEAAVKVGASQAAAAESDTAAQHYAMQLGQALEKCEDIQSLKEKHAVELEKRPSGDVSKARESCLVALLADAEKVSARDEVATREAEELKATINKLHHEQTEKDTTIMALQQELAKAVKAKAAKPRPAAKARQKLSKKDTEEDPPAASRSTAASQLKEEEEELCSEDEEGVEFLGSSRLPLREASNLACVNQSPATGSGSGKKESMKRKIKIAKR